MFGGTQLFTFQFRPRGTEDAVDTKPRVVLA
jgi:hypothetical protein